MTLIFLPELLLLGASLLLFLLALVPVSGRCARRIALCATLAGSVLTGFTLQQEGTLFYGAFQVDFFSQLVKLLLLAGAFLVLLIARELKGIREEIRPEYYLFLLLSVTGLVVLVSAVELMLLFVALELSSFALYVLVPMRDDASGLRTQMEAGIKYILFGVMATGVMLYGMSYIFGLTSSTHLHVIVPKLHALGPAPAVVAAVAMVMAGLFFKLAVFPFHFWMPDVYQGASNETTAFVASVPKVAGLAVLCRILFIAPQWAGDDGLTTLLIVCAIGSMIYGNLAALVQQDLKRMLGFSGIAHAGYMLLGLVGFGAAGFSIALYYITGYMLMNLACFLVICNVSATGDNLAVSELSGLHRRAPLLALTLLVGMFALAGIPPFVGFMGKFLLLKSAFQQGHTALVVIAAINTALAMYYYLSVVRVSFCTTDDAVVTPIVTNWTTRIAGLLLIGLILLLGILPAQFLDLTSQAFAWMG